MTRRNDFGGVGLWIVLLILGIGVWVGYSIGRFYFDHKTIENEIAAIGDDTLLAKRGDGKDKIIQLLNNYGAAFDKDKIVSDVSGAGDKINISVSYQRFADLIVTQVPLQFDVNIQREARKAVGIINQVQESVEDSGNVAAQKYQKALQNSGTNPPPSE